MKKTVEIDFSDDRLIGIAADMVDEHNYIGALKMLNKNAAMTGNDADCFMLYAEIFDDLGLHMQCINNWFRFMDVVDDEEDLTECYEGLAVNYMELGNEEFSAYYYHKLLVSSDDGEAAAELRDDLMKDYVSSEENPLKFVYPPEIADLSDVISDGITHMKEGDYAKARELFESVPENNPQWASARNYLAMCLIIDDKDGEAERECRSVLEKNPDDVQALTTLAAVLTESGKSEEANKITKKLLSLDVKGQDDIYKIATVCCENGMHAQAYEQFCKMDSDFGNDLTILFFKAVSAFNCGMYDESFAAFDKLTTIYPDAVTARYYYNLARALKEQGADDKLGYFYRLPQEMRQSSLKLLAAYVRLPHKKAELFAQEVDISSLVKWCFDEAEPSGVGDLQYLAMHAAIKAEMNDYLRDLLLNAFLPEKFKLETLELLAERDVYDDFGIVVCNVFRRVTTRKLKIGRMKKKAFVSAYARLVAHFAVIEDEYGDKFARSAEKLYRKLQKEEKLDVADDIEALTAAVFYESKVRDAGVTTENICSFFNVSEERLERARGMI